MAQTQINLDDAALRRARERLGTSSKVDTVNTALRVAAEIGPHPRQRYVSTSELREALSSVPAVDFEQLRAEGEAAAEESLDAEEAHLDELFNAAADQAWHNR